MSPVMLLQTHPMTELIGPVPFFFALFSKASRVHCRAHADNHHYHREYTYTQASQQVDDTNYRDMPSDYRLYSRRYVECKRNNHTNNSQYNGQYTHRKATRSREAFTAILAPRWSPNQENALAVCRSRHPLEPRALASWTDDPGAASLQCLWAVFSLESVACAHIESRMTVRLYTE